MDIRSRETGRAAAERRESDEQTGGGPLRAALLGAQGGAVATVVMTVYRLPVFRALPPTADFWAKYVGGGEPEEYLLEGLALHLLYGAGGGVPFGVLFDRFAPESRSSRRRTGFVFGVLYGLLLSVFGTRVVFRGLLDQDLDDDESFVFVVGHLVYGTALGTWMTSRRSFGEAYD